MAYRPGKYVREFFTSGGFTLTDRSPKYGPGKIPLFKSLSRLNKKELLYAVGYNLSTLGAFGVDTAMIGAIPYYVGQYANTINSFRKNLKNPSNVLGGQIIARQKLLGGAKLIGRFRPAVTNALKTNTPIDRATNIIVGRETQAMLKQARSAGAAGTIVNLIQSVNPTVMDNQLLKQAEIPNKGNVFVKWRDRTFAEAYTNSPDPFSNNPIMQLRKAQAKREAARAKRGGRSRTYGPDKMIDLQFDIPQNPVSVDKVLSQLSLSDAGLLVGTGRGGRQKTIAEAMESAIANQKYQNDANIMGLSQSARNELYRQNEHDRVGKLLAFGESTRTYADRGLQGTLTDKRNPVIAPGERDIRAMNTTQQIDTHTLRENRQSAMTQFTKAAQIDADNLAGALPTDLFFNKEGMDEFKNFLRAFGQPITKLNSITGPRQAARLLSSALTMISHQELGENIVNLFTQSNAIDRFSKVLIDQGYTNLGNQLRSLYNFDRDDIRSPRPQGIYATRLSELNRLKEFNKSGAQITKMFVTDSGGDYLADLRFRPAGELIYNSDYVKEAVLKGKQKSNFNLKNIKLGEKGQATDSFIQNVLSPSSISSDSISYVDLVSGNLKGIDIIYDAKGMPVVKKFGNLNSLYGKSEAWWQKRVTMLHNNYAKVAQATNTMALFNGFASARGNSRKTANALLREHLQEMKKIIGNNYDADDLMNYLIGEFERVDSRGNRQGFIENRGQSTIRNQAMDGTGKSVKYSTSHNYVPIKTHIQKSIFMHRMDRKGVNENDGTQFLFRYRVSAGGKSAKSKYADGIRDIFSVEYGGPLHDRNYSLEKRTDGMFLLPSNFMGKAGTRSAAFFGIFDTGSQFKAMGPRGMGTFKMTDSVDGVKQTTSPYDAHIPGNKKLGIAKQSVRKNLNKDKRALKKTRQQGIRRVMQLEKDFARVVKDNKSVLGGGGHVDEARIAAQRAFSLYKQGGGTGLVPGANIFEAMSGADRYNLGIVGNDIADISQLKMSKLGFYGGKHRVVLGEFTDRDILESADGMEFSHMQGSKNLSRFAANFYSKPDGTIAGGEMPVVQANDSDLYNLGGLFRDAKGRIDYKDMENFTGIPSDTLKNIKFETGSSPNKIFLEKLGLDLDMNLNPASDPVLKKILNSPFENMATQFDLHMKNGPFLSNKGNKRSLNAASHPINKYKRVFLTDKVLNGLNYELVKIMEDRLSDVIRGSDAGTKKIIRAAIRESAKNEVYKFKSRMNQLHFRHINALDSDEAQFRQILLGQAYSMERAKINAGKHAWQIGNRYRKDMPPGKTVQDEYFGSDADEVDFRNLHYKNIVPSVTAEGGYDIHFIHAPNEKKEAYVNVRKFDIYDNKTGTGRSFYDLEQQMISYYNPEAQALRDFAKMGQRGIDDIKSVSEGNNVLTSYYRGRFVEALQTDEILRDYYTSTYGDDIINDFMKGKYRDSNQANEFYGNINDLLKGEHATAVNGGVHSVINTTSIQRGQSIQELLVVQTQYQSQKRKEAFKNVSDTIFGDRYRSPKKLGKDVWYGSRAVAEMINPQSFNKRLAAILNDGTTTGYFSPGTRGNRERMEFIKGVWHSSFRVQTNLKEVMNTKGMPEYQYGFHTKTLDFVKNKEQIPQEALLIINAFSQLGIDISRRKLAHNTITDLPLLHDSDFNQIAKRLMELYPTESQTNTPFGLSLVTFHGNIKRRLNRGTFDDLR